MTTTVVLPGARVVQAPRDPRLGVRVDGARRLDEDEHLRLREQRARQHEPLALPARERASALVDGRVEPLRAARPGRPRRSRPRRRRGSPRRRRALPRVELAAERPGEEHRVGLADDDPAADVGGRQVGDRDVAEHDAVARPRSGRAGRRSRRLVGQRRDEAGEPARLDDEPGARVDERHAGRRLAAGDSRLGDRRARPRARPASGARRRARA